jgi:hypothetical protein
LRSAREVVGRLPPEEAGEAVLATDARPFRGEAAELEKALGANALLFHEGAIGRVPPGRGPSRTLVDSGQGQALDSFTGHPGRPAEESAGGFAKSGPVSRRAPGSSIR